MVRAILSPEEVQTSLTVTLVIVTVIFIYAHYKSKKTYNNYQKKLYYNLAKWVAVFCSIVILVFLIFR